MNEKYELRIETEEKGPEVDLKITMNNYGEGCTKHVNSVSFNIFNLRNTVFVNGIKDLRVEFSLLGNFKGSLLIESRR